MQTIIVKYALSFCCLVTLCTPPNVALASLLGDMVRMEIPATEFAEDYAIREGPERFFRGFVLDFQSERIVYSFTVSTSFSPSSSHHFSDLDWRNSDGVLLPGAIEGVDVVSTFQFDSSRVAFDTNSIVIDWSEVQFEAGDTAMFLLAVSHIPEPTPCTLLLSGMACFAINSRGRFKPVHA